MEIIIENGENMLSIPHIVLALIAFYGLAVMEVKQRKSK
jgi:hypothetical protein